MKDRARAFGENGAHELLARLQIAAPRARFHLMGHSFGCIVASATVAGPAGQPDLPRPVDSLFLVQGALSLWSYASDIPYAAGTAGYFHRIVKHGLVRGPIVTTRSSHDTAVGRFYPLGAQLKKQLVLGDQLPAYGGIGSFGIQGAKGARGHGDGRGELRLRLQAGAIYNLEASGVIKNGGGASGAHSDIAHPEVAHAFWAAALAAPPLPPAGTLVAGLRQRSGGRNQGAAGTRGGSGDTTASGGPDFDTLSISDDAWAPLGLAAAGSARCRLRADATPAASAAVPDRDPARVRADAADPLPRRTAADQPERARAARAGADAGAKRAFRQRRTRGPAGRRRSSKSAAWYTLAVDIDVGQRPDVLTATPFADESLFAQGVDETTVDGPARQRRLRHPRSGSGRCECLARASRATRRASRSDPAARRAVVAHRDAPQGGQLRAEHRHHGFVVGGTPTGERRDDDARPAGVEPRACSSRATSASLLAPRRERLRRAPSAARSSSSRAPAAAARLPRQRGRGRAAAS